MEFNPRKFLDTKMPHIKGMMYTSVVRKETKIPNLWSSAILKIYERNAMLGEELRANRIAVPLNMNLHT